MGGVLNVGAYSHRIRTFGGPCACDDSRWQAGYKARRDVAASSRVFLCAFNIGSLLPLSLRGTRIVPVAVRLTDSSIRTMNLQLGALVLADLATDIDRFSLGVGPVRCAFRTIPFHLPATIWMRHCPVGVPAHGYHLLHSLCLSGLCQRAVIINLHSAFAREELLHEGFFHLKNKGPII